MKSIENLNHIENKKILLRLDLNVPILNGKITDTNRIDKILPTIKFLLSKKAKIIIISHIGRPKGKVCNDLSLEPITSYLKQKINKKILLIKENIYNLKKEDIFKNCKLYCLKILDFTQRKKIMMMSFRKNWQV